MAKFMYNNAKNTSCSYTAFELNCGYYLQMFYKKNVNLRFKSNSANELLAKLKELMFVYRKNLYYIQEFEKRIHNGSVKLKNHALAIKFS